MKERIIQNFVRLYFLWAEWTWMSILPLSDSFIYIQIRISLPLGSAPDPLAFCQLCLQSVIWIHLLLSLSIASILDQATVIYCLESCNQPLTSVFPVLNHPYPLPTFYFPPHSQTDLPKITQHKSFALHLEEIPIWPTRSWKICSSLSL